jgi:hypothetical protein
VTGQVSCGSTPPQGGGFASGAAMSLAKFLGAGFLRGIGLEDDGIVEDSAVGVKNFPDDFDRLEIRAFAELNLGLFNGFFALMAFVGLVDCPLAAALNMNLEGCILAHWFLGGNE